MVITADRLTCWIVPVLIPPLTEYSQQIIHGRVKGRILWPEPDWSIPESPVFPGCQPYYSRQSCVNNWWEITEQPNKSVWWTEPMWLTFVSWRTYQSRNGRSHSPPYALNMWCFVINIIHPQLVVSSNHQSSPAPHFRAFMKIMVATEIVVWPWCRLPSRKNHKVHLVLPTI